MKRPYETAKIILKNNNIQIEKIESLVEINHGLWEGKLEEEIKQIWPEMLRDWHEKPESVTMPEGESIKQVSDRAISAWNHIYNSQEKNDTTF